MPNAIVTAIISLAASAADLIGSLRKKKSATLDPPIKKTAAELAVERIQARRAAERLEQDKDGKP